MPNFFEFLLSDFPSKVGKEFKQRLKNSHSFFTLLDVLKLYSRLPNSPLQVTIVENSRQKS